MKIRASLRYSVNDCGLRNAARPFPWRKIWILNLMKISQSRFFVIILDVYYDVLKTVTYVMSYTDMYHW